LTVFLADLTSQLFSQQQSNTVPETLDFTLLAGQLAQTIGGSAKSAKSANFSQQLMLGENHESVY
jgi:hypothetical protein